MQTKYSNTAPNKNNIGRGVSLTEKEKGKFVALSKAKASSRKIAKAIGKS